MATKIVRLNYSDNMLLVQNFNSASQLIRDGSGDYSFKVSSESYSDGDQIEFRLPGAKEILYMSIQNADTGGIVNLDPENPVGNYTRNPKDTIDGKFIRTGPIPNPVDLCVNIRFSDRSDSLKKWLYAKVEET